MACGHSAALLLLLTTLGLGQRPHPQPGPPGLQHSYDCGVKGMQLLVFPPLGQAIHFKVAGECQRSPGPHLPGYSGELGPFPCGRTGRVGASRQSEGGGHLHHIRGGGRKAGSQPRFL